MVETNSGTLKDSVSIEKLAINNKNKQLLNIYNLCIGQGWKTYNNIFIPILRLESMDNTFISIWSDEIAIKISKQNYCVECGAETPLRNCSTCQMNEKYKKYQCIITKAGEPFGGVCSQLSIPCGLQEYANEVCYSEYVIYIGRKENSWKVGISRYNREGVESGFLIRLIEQGLEEALLIRAKDNFNLPEAQNIENRISDELGINQKLTKRTEIIKLPELENLVKGLHKEIITEKFPNLLQAGMFSPWMGLIDAKKLFREKKILEMKAGAIINGKILASWGKESLVKTPEEIIKINRDQLLGRKLLPLNEEEE